MIPTYGPNGEVIALDFAQIFPRGLSDWEDAERLGLAVMLYLGFDDAQLTARGVDAGIDVSARNACCQVKHWSSTVGRRELQQLVGAAFGRDTVFLATSYSAQAVEYAEAARLALFVFDPTARVLCANPQAKVIASRPQHPPMTPEHSAITQRQRRALSNFSIVAMRIDAFSNQLLRAAATRKGRKDGQRALAGISQWTKDFGKANEKLQQAARRGSNRDAEKGLFAMNVGGVS